MHSINFEILRKDRPALAELGTFAEDYLHSDPAGSLTKRRIYGELRLENAVSNMRKLAENER